MPDYSPLPRPRRAAAMPSAAYLESLVGIPEVNDGGKPLDPYYPSQ